MHFPLKKGFTLIELLIVVGIMAVFLTGTLVMLNPVGQFDKSKDVKRQSQLKTIQTALDTYYNDHGCYPASIPFNSLWTQSGTTYLRQVPEDEDCLVGRGSCYVYQTDGSSCPQWNVLYAQLHSVLANKFSCSLSKMTNCLPSNYNLSNYNYCVLSGNINCPYLSQSSLIIPTPPAPTSGSSSGSITPGPVSPTPTSIPPTPVPGCPGIYSCSTPNSQYPLGVCQNVGNGGSYCGYPNCSGNSCCANQCSQ
jgi:prepilin-type N-terminal cleavage/methylation domain-containing protein